ncbi:hypothetical protein IWX90DRAFT_216111 [Phyllosticta citrichinensis]|uniref:Uncharacterized protein n=1 Tax=Phyllosticta citrichinensis TaxID=1130410 RepID=A0ABR1XTD0_9PEZI
MDQHIGHREPTLYPRDVNAQKARRERGKTAELVAACAPRQPRQASQRQTAALQTGDASASTGWRRWWWCARQATWAATYIAQSSLSPNLSTRGEVEANGQQADGHDWWAPDTQLQLHATPNLAPVTHPDGGARRLCSSARKLARVFAHSRGARRESKWAAALQQVLGLSMAPPLSLSPPPPGYYIYIRLCSVANGRPVWYLLYPHCCSIQHGSRNPPRTDFACLLLTIAQKHAILEAILNLNLDVKDESGHSFFDFFCSLLYQCTEASATTAASSAEELAIELWNRFPRRHKSSSPWTHPPLLNFTLLALYRRRAAWYGWYKPIEEAAMSKWLAHVGHSMPLCVGSCPICEAYSRIHGGVL